MLANSRLRPLQLQKAEGPVSTAVSVDLESPGTSRAGGRTFQRLANEWQLTVDQQAAENAKLKKATGERDLDIDVLKEINRRKW